MSIAKNPSSSLPNPELHYSCPACGGALKANTPPTGIYGLISMLLVGAVIFAFVLISGWALRITALVAAILCIAVLIWHSEKNSQGIKRWQAIKLGE